MLSEYDIVLSEFGQRRHLFFVARIVKAINGDKQDVLPATHITIAQLAERILYADGFRIPLLDQTTLIFLSIQQAVFLKETACRHRV